MRNKEKAKKYARKYYLEHREHLRDLAKKWRNSNLEKCRKYGTEYSRKWRSENREKFNKDTREYRKKNKERIQITAHNSQKRRREKRRNEIFKLLGDKCSNPNCPIPIEKMDRRVLQIDHVNSNGCEEFRKFHHSVERQYNYILEQIKSGSKDYQLLCVYCNWVKRYNNAEFGGI